MLQEALEKQRIKTNHSILREVKKSKRTTLCVILESLSTKEDGDLSEVNDITGIYYDFYVLVDIFKDLFNLGCQHLHESLGI